jgi:GDPmannose 4,6-dehydratase
MKKALIIGISGQDGSYLAELLLNEGYEVHGTSRDADLSGFYGLKRLNIYDRVHLHSMSLTDFRSVMQGILQVEPDEIYNLAGQSSVGLSFLQPVETLESISVGTLNILEVLPFSQTAD